MALPVTACVQRRERHALRQQLLRFWSFIKACDDSFTQSLFGDELFASEREAQRIWPACRRSVWARTRRMHLPRAAEVFDLLTRDGWAAMWDARGCVRFAFDEVMVALARDRVSVEVFARRDPRGAEAIRPYLGCWLEDLDALEALARAVAKSGEPPWACDGWDLMTRAGYYDTAIDPTTVISGF